MAVDGTYNIEISTPMGAQSAKLTLKADGGNLSGQMDGNQFGKTDCSGTVNGNEVSWSVEVSNPMVGKITLTFSGTVNGDEISGNVQLGSFGSSQFKGTRA